MRAKLTVLIPCKNEEQNIAACVESARLVADEILVADSGSSDRTLDLVERMADIRLIEREFISYSSFKNWAIPQAHHEWVLILDADERVTPELAAEIQAVLGSPRVELDGYWIRRRNFFMGHLVEHSGWQGDKVLRLIRRDRCRYGDCRVHERMNVAPERTGRLRARLDHFSCWTYDQLLAKQLKYVKLGAADRWDHGRRASYLHMLFAPILRFALVYTVRGGWRDGFAGLQYCFLQAFVTFLKEARLWELEQAGEQPLEPMLELLDDDSDPTEFVTQVSRHDSQLHSTCS